MFPNQDASTPSPGPIREKFIDVSIAPRRIVGIAADVDDENLRPSPDDVVYHPIGSGVRRPAGSSSTRMDPYSLVPPITKIIRGLSADQRRSRRRRSRTWREECFAGRLNALVSQRLRRRGRRLPSSASRVLAFSSERADARVGVASRSDRRRGTC